ncbi:type III-B CRISPR module RAMP protein Cmr4 [Allorhodopirellula heiligendammensis]|uniref:RAMP superfamily protein n=1 Tax=Allorhodopirellula heiligendammensis TaxID=2714739 RepID=A0A5C6C3S9_9BACT|nr:type III-B CRISPR module RAMP protein Cmr4 [Allorhodopirellula heiligendammensis]TWU17954.1 RAMP superfamily protein [Allorhodopirellula heiligendammensis]
MNSRLFGMLAETSVHPGGGQDAGFVDLPVAREKATDYPVIVGSSLKGAIKDAMRDVQLKNIDQIFGRQENAGQLIVGDARLLLLPVRSLQGAYRWTTCSQLLNRFSRDAARTGVGGLGKIPRIGDGDCMCTVATGKPVYLEERQFDSIGEVDGSIIEMIRPLMPSVSDFLHERLVVLSDDDFAWFARYGLSVNARNQLDIETKTSKNLWYEETLPPDSLFYCILSDRGPGVKAVAAIESKLNESGYLQVGGNQTVGQGVFAVTPISSDASPEAAV